MHEATDGPACRAHQSVSPETDGLMESRLMDATETVASMSPSVRETDGRDTRARSPETDGLTDATRARAHTRARAVASVRQSGRLTD